VPIVCKRARLPEAGIFRGYKTMNRPKLWTLVLVSAGLAWAWGGVCRGETGVEAITRPCEDRTLSFDTPGKIAMIAVKVGDAVKAGQVLARQDTKVEQARAEQLKATADDTIRVDAQVAKLKQTQVDLKKFEEAKKRGAATALEVEHARLEVTIAELSLQLAKFERGQAKRAYDEKMLEIDRMELHSPIDGSVAAIYRRAGESADTPKKPAEKVPLKGVIRVVKIEPLWVDVPVARDPASRLKKGGTAKVRFPPSGAASAGSGAAEGPARDGTIIHIAQEVDPASDTRIVRVEVPNPGGRRPAGERVTVRFPGADKAARTAAADRPKGAASGATKE
jgi:membrane fusion protein (multidrug efflux system)